MSDWATEELIKLVKNLRKPGDVERLRKKAQTNTSIRNDGKRMFDRTHTIKRRKEEKKLKERKRKDIPANFKSIYWLDYKD